MSVDAPPSLMPRCSVHPDELASGTCQRCGGFFCAACSTPVMGELYCPTCAARPDVNYLEAFRQKYWGKRDAGAYIVGFGALLAAWGAVVALLNGAFLGAQVLLAVAGVGAAYFLGARWSRLPMLFTPLVLGLGATVMSDTPFFLPGLLVFMAAARIYLDTRGKLFFREEVPEKDLRRLWDRRVNNPLAQYSVALGVGAVVLPVLAPLAIALGFVALRRVDLQARPPIGRRGHALAGIALGLGTLVFWAVFVVPWLMGGAGRMFWR